MSNKRLIDGDMALSKRKLLDWVYNGNAAGFTIGEFTSLINLGAFNLPSDQGEAARLREALVRVKVVAEEESRLSESRLLEIFRIASEALSSHKEDAEYVGPSKSSMGLMLNADGGKADE